jgi:hypothetical protein
MRVGEQPGAAADRRRGVVRALPAVLTEAVLVQKGVLPVVAKVALVVGVVVRPMEVRAASVEGHCWVAAAVVPPRDSALRPVWAVFDRSSRNPALSH